jgi:hypothetical protein
MNDMSTEPGALPPTYESNRPNVTPTRSSLGSGELVSIITVLAITIIMLCCIGACALLGFAFFQNPPW